MRVAFGVSALAAGMQRGGVDGIGSVTRELLGRLQSSSDVDVLPYEFAHTVSGEIPGAVSVGSFQRQALCSLGAPLSFPVMRRVLHGRVDLVHATDHSIPRLRGLPVLATLMDAIPLSHPQWVDYRFKTIMNAAWRRSAHWADHVLTISEFSKQEIMQHFGIAEDRITAVPLGVSDRWFQQVDEEHQDRVRQHYGLPEHFFLFVGTLQPRKNLGLLLDVYGALPEDVRSNFPLVVVGREGWGCEDLVSRLASAKESSIYWLRYLPDSDLPVVVSQATALLFPSLYEGFGLPILESFAAGTPVIAARASCLPEVAGDAAVLLDPLDPVAWRDTILALTGAPAWVDGFVDRGRKRARLFSWDNTARKTIDLYQRMV